MDDLSKQVEFQLELGEAGRIAWFDVLDCIVNQLVDVGVLDRAELVQRLRAIPPRHKRRRRSEITSRTELSDGLVRMFVEMVEKPLKPRRSKKATPD